MKESARKVLDRIAGRDYRPPLKPYMAYSREMGAQECAILIFAPTAKEAKKLGWLARDFLTDEFTDLAVKFLKDEPWIFKDANQEKLHLRTPHVIENPSCCKSCEHWGLKLNENGLCEDCQELDV